MCGIIAIVRRRQLGKLRQLPAAADLLARLSSAAAILRGCQEIDATLAARLKEAGDLVGGAERELRGVAGVRALVGDPSLVASLETYATELAGMLDRIDGTLDSHVGGLPERFVEELNAGVTRLRDAAWALQRDRIEGARAVGLLSGADPPAAALEAYASVQTALSALDRLEVRGRDSAGIHLLVTGHALDLGDPEVMRLLAGRRDGVFTDGEVRVAAGTTLSFVYKVAREIGDLGDNGAALRASIAGDALLRRALANDTAQTVVLAHTRWASIGAINEANAHPLNQESRDGGESPYVVAAVNGDVDNYARLMTEQRLSPPPEITTDAKVIPMLIAQGMQSGASAVDSFRRAVNAFEGSMAIAALAASQPDQLLLAQQGSGQALYVGLCDDMFVVASEPYGIVEEADRYVCLDASDGAAGSGDHAAGRIVALSAAGAGTIEGIARYSYDGTAVDVTSADVKSAQITTRDIDRGEYPHYLLKEITQAAGSLRKTLRGRIVERNGRLTPALGDHAWPPEVAARLADGSIDSIYVIGQGTARVAAVGVATAIDDAVEQRIRVIALPATELSAHHLTSAMGNVLVVAISQSGTTTDTNRTVHLARSRGAAVVAIVNRRGSDLTHNADGVIYTADGRDVEMSVASTKAFYAQIAAGQLLACEIGRACGSARSAAAAQEEHELLTALRELPAAMTQTLARREDIREIAGRIAPSRRNWALVGSGHSSTAAEEIRIKASELCYKSIPCDFTEDKKHIDLSTEPMTLVCAAGSGGSTIDDTAKEVAIFAAHKGAPIVIATDGEDRFTAAAAVIFVPAVHPKLDFVLVTLAGHLFSYEAACAIDAVARPLREARAILERVVHEVGVDRPDMWLPAVSAEFDSFRRSLEEGRCDSALDASTALRLVAVLRLTTGDSPRAWECFEDELVAGAEPQAAFDAVIGGLTSAIDELRRPIDAIKHQAKTVTVGVGRSDESLLDVPLIKDVIATGARRERLRFASLRTLAALDAAVECVNGFTRYAVVGDPATGQARIALTGRGGIARDLQSRVSADGSELLGTKLLVARDHQVLAAKGRRDGRTVILVPELQGASVVGLTLLHVSFREHLGAGEMRRVLEGYRSRWYELHAAVTEVDPSFDQDRLDRFTVEDLITAGIDELAAALSGLEIAGQNV